MTTTILLEDILFFKSDARKLLDKHDIVLNDNFIIERNKTSSAIGDYYHFFELSISEKDKERIIAEIRSEANFEDNRADSSNLDVLYLYRGNKKVLNFETETRVVKESFIPSEEKGYAPTYHIITLYKNSNKLKFEDIDE